jgi:prepilin-type N-terminal cleavage/methylation domain-containing protein
MGSGARALAALRGEERGFTLIELLVATTLGLVVVGAALAMFIGGVRSEPRTAAKVAAIQDARVVLDRITREVRQGIEVEASLPSRLEILTYVKATSCDGSPAATSIPCKVTYECAGDACTRTVAEPDGSSVGSPRQVVDGLVSTNVFDVEPDTDPTYVGVNFTLISGDDDPVTLGDGVALRNFEGAGA